MTLKLTRAHLRHNVDSFNGRQKAYGTGGTGARQQFTTTNETEPQTILREIREAREKIIKLQSAQQAATEKQVRESRVTIAESVNIQRLGLRRQRTVTLVAVPGLLAPISAIAFMVIKYL